MPTILKMMVEHPAVDRYDHSSLRYIIYAGAPMYREDQKAALKKLGKVLVQYFGLGEVTGNITVLPPDLHDPEDGPHARIGTCGFERTGMQVSIQGDDGRELKPFETGEICVIGPAVFAGYYDNPEANAKAFRDGWFRTGDLGHMDEEGFVYITGRASDMYISGGSNIYPREVEEKILTHPAIGEVAVLGVPDPVWGEVGVAVCVRARGRKRGERGRDGGVPRAESAALQNAEAFLLLGGAAEIRLRQGAEAAGARRTGSARVCSISSRKADGADLMRQHRPARPARARAHPVGGSARPRLLLHAASRPAAAGSRAPRLCRGRICRRRAEHQERRARPVRLCDAGAVQDRRERGVLQRHLSARRRHAAQDGRDDAGRARRRAVLPLPRAVDARPTAASMAAISCPRKPWSPSPSRSKLSASMARSSRRSRTPRPISSCSGRLPRTASGAETTSRAFALRLRPNQDFAGALEAFCREHGILRARLHGGVGSTIGARFTDGRSVVPFATELASAPASIAPGADGTLEAELDVALVDYLGGLAEGRLMRGDNPVLMTMELVLEVLARGHFVGSAMARMRRAHVADAGGHACALPILQLRFLFQFSNSKRHVFAFSRRDAPEPCIYLPPNRGRGECRVPVAPAASCAMCGSKHTSIVTARSTGITRHSRTQWF